MTGHWDPAPRPRTDHGTCGKCARPVLWAKTRNNATIPLDPEPNDAGNQAGARDVHGTMRVHVITDEDRQEGWERRYMPHMATCGANPPKPDIRPSRAVHKAPTLFDGDDGCPVVPIAAARNRARTRPRGL